jgi:hypothetical protein
MSFQHFVKLVIRRRLKFRCRGFGAIGFVEPFDTATELPERALVNLLRRKA